MFDYYSFLTEIKNETGNGTQTGNDFPKHTTHQVVRICQDGNELWMVIT